MTKSTAHPHRHPAGAACRSVDTPVGRLHVVATDDAIVAIEWAADEPPVPTVDSGTHEVLDRAVAQLTEYFDGTRTEFDLPVAPAGTEFQRSAWAELASIPYGETITYGEQARRLGDPNKSRAVGAANGKNPIPIVVPCHRVVGSTGKLTGFAGGVETKAWLLDHEIRVRAATFA